METAKKDEVRKDWEPMNVAEVGHVGDVLQMPGNGKISTVTGDSGDPKKPKGQG